MVREVDTIPAGGPNLAMRQQQNLQTRVCDFCQKRKWFLLQTMRHALLNWPVHGTGAPGPRSATLRPPTHPPALPTASYCMASATRRQLFSCKSRVRPARSKHLRVSDD